MVVLKNIQTIRNDSELAPTTIFPDTTKYATVDKFNSCIEIRTIPEDTLIDKRPLSGDYPNKDVTAIGISDDSAKIAVNYADGEEVSLLDVSSIPMKHSDKLSLFDYKTCGVAISSNGNELLLSDKRTIFCINLRTARGRTITRNFAKPRQLFTACFSPDETQVALGYFNGTVELWGVKTASLLLTIRALSQNPVSSLVFSRDGKFLFCGSENNSITLYNLIDEKVSQVFNGHDRYITDIVLSSDGSKLVSASGDKTVRLWDTNNGSTLAIAQCNNPVHSVAISPDSRRIVSLDSTNVIQVWDIN